MKKILMIALLAGFISTASAKTNGVDLLVKPNVSSSSLLSKVTTMSFGGFCLQNCINAYNYCIANPTTNPNHNAGCSAKWESCTARCGVEGGPNP